MRQLNRREMVSALGLGAGMLFLCGCQSGRSGWKPLTAEQLRGGAPRPQGPIRHADSLAAPPPGVLGRAHWTSSQPIASLANPMGPITRITVHHDAMNSAGIRTREDAARRLELIRIVHVRQQWADIGYHYIIDPQGRIWEGRPVRLRGAHVKDHNDNNLAIMLMGNFDEQAPTPAALAALDGFVADQMRRYAVPVGRVFTHQEFNPTACPGRSLQAYMLDARSRRGRLAQV